MTTAVILAGGKSSRMGRDKLALPLGGETLLQAAVRRFSERFDRVFISVADPGKYPEVSAQRICDVFKGCGPMGGLHAALTRLGGDVFLAAADLPFSDPAAALALMALGDGFDAVVPLDAEGRYEPLFGWYAPAVLPVLERLLGSGNYRMTEALSAVRTRFVKPEELGCAWREGLLSNVNRPEDYERVMRMLGDRA